MSYKEQIEMAKTSVGRIKLHIIAFINDFNWKTHYRGIMREINK